MDERKNKPIIWDGVYQLEPDFFPELAKYNNLRVRARVYGLNSEPQKLTIEVGLVNDPRLPDGVPPDSLQGRIRMLLWNAFGDIKDDDVIFIKEHI